MSNSVKKPVLTLKQFILRQEVIKLYRNIFRTIKQIPDKASQEELKEWARRDFRNNAHHTDENAIRTYILYGERSLKELQTNLNLSK